MRNYRAVCVITTTRISFIRLPENDTSIDLSATYKRFQGKSFISCLILTMYFILKQCGYDTTTYLVNILSFQYSENVDVAQMLRTYLGIWPCVNSNLLKVHYSVTQSLGGRKFEANRQYRISLVPIPRYVTGEYIDF